MACRVGEVCRVGKGAHGTPLTPAHESHARRAPRSPLVIPDHSRVTAMVGTALQRAGGETIIGDRAFAHPTALRHHAFSVHDFKQPYSTQRSAVPLKAARGPRVPLFLSPERGGAERRDGATWVAPCDRRDQPRC